MKKFLLTSALATACFIGYFNTSEAATTTEAIYKNQEAVEQRVREYFADIPVMIEIARCESNFRQYTDSGSVLRGGYGGGMVGAFQFFESVHAAAATTQSYDLTTLEGNIAYARHVYETEGTTPWNSAKSCWNTAQVSTQTTSTLNQQQILQKKIELLLQLISLLKELQAKQSA